MHFLGIAMIHFWTARVLFLTNETLTNALPTQLVGCAKCLAPYNFVRLCVGQPGVLSWAYYRVALDLPYTPESLNTAICRATMIRQMTENCCNHSGQICRQGRHA